MQGGLGVQIRIGISQEHKEKAAVAQALAESRSESRLPDLTVLFYAGDYDLRAVWEACSDILNHSPFIGGQVGAIFTMDRIFRQGVAALSVYGVKAQTRITPVDITRAYREGQELGASFVEDSVQEGAVLMLPHVHNYKLSALIRGIYSNLGPSFQYFGAGTVSQFTEAGYTDEGVALALVEEAYFTQGVGHGWMPLGEPMLITRAERNRIYELDGQPAVQRYCAVVREMLDQEIDITGHKFQLGIPCGSGDYVVRDIIEVEDQALVCVTEIPPKSMVSLMTTSIPALPAVAKRITEETLDQHPEPKFAIMFDCVSRERLQKDSFILETQNIYRVLGDLPALGVLTFGEISSSFGIPLYHNKALSVTIGGEGR